MGEVVVGWVDRSDVPRELVALVPFAGEDVLKYRLLSVVELWELFEGVSGSCAAVVEVVDAFVVSSSSFIELVLISQPLTF